MKELGLAPNDIASLQKMEWAKLIAAGNAAVAKINPPGRPVMGPGLLPARPRVGWSPIRRWQDHQHALVLRRALRRSPKNVPMLIGSVSEEGNRMSSSPTEEEWHATLGKTYGDDKATAIIAAMKKAYPEKRSRLCPTCAVAPGLNGLSMRNNVVKMVRAEARTEGRAGLRLLLHLANADARWPTRRMAHGRTAILLRQHQALRTGNRQYSRGPGAGEEDGLRLGGLCRNRKPSISGVTWEPTDPETNKTMVWDNECRMVDDPDGEARKIILA